MHLLLCNYFLTRAVGRASVRPAANRALFEPGGRSLTIESVGPENSIGVLCPKTMGGGRGNAPVNSLSIGLKLLTFNCGY